MRKQYNRPKGKPRQTIYNIIVNPRASEYSPRGVEQLKEKIEKGGGRYFLNEPESAQEAVQLVKRIINKRPSGIIICGGDGTVNLAARHLIRRTIPIGIIPMGRFNNIYRSLHGEPDIDEAIEHALSKKSKKIDYGMAERYFFIGSLSIGLVPEMMEILQTRKTPRFAIGWSRLASQAAAGIKVKEISIKVDEFAFDLSPQTINVNLLPNTVGLPITPSSVPDDGKCEVVFDTGLDKAIMSNYIRQIFKKKYLYAEEVRIFRGERIALKPMLSRKLYIDGELVTCKFDELNIETHNSRIRVLHKQGK